MQRPALLGRDLVEIPRLLEHVVPVEEGPGLDGVVARLDAVEERLGVLLDGQFAGFDLGLGLCGREAVVIRHDGMVVVVRYEGLLEGVKEGECR